MESGYPIDYQIVYSLNEIWRGEVGEADAEVHSQYKVYHTVKMLYLSP
jgi:hypothetical protein